jgi:peptidoglycan/LPS O-acetylase OafA/YrhL
MPDMTGNLVASPSGDLVADLPAPENKKFYPALDGFRAIAVLMVFCEHYLHLWPSLSWGWTGVDFFFVLSGFLITGILYDTRDATHRFRSFYIRRSLRIFPLYYGVLLTAALIDPIFHWIRQPVRYLWPLYLSNYARFIWLTEYTKYGTPTEHLLSSIHSHPPFLLAFGHFWSLCVEEQFYLLWPPIVFLVSDRKRLRNLCVLMCILCVAARAIAVHFIPQTYLNAGLLYRVTPFRIDALLLGGALALMLRGPEAAYLGRIMRPALLSFVASFVTFEAIYRLVIHHAYHPIISTPALSTFGFTLIDLFAGLVILLALDSSSFLYRIFTVRSLRRLGQMSYGFYVFHDIPHVAYIMLVTRIYGPSRYFDFLVAAVALACTLFLSYLSFRFFETPFLRLKNRFAA